MSIAGLCQNRPVAARSRRRPTGSLPTGARRWKCRPRWATIACGAPEVHLRECWEVKVGCRRTACMLAGSALGLGYLPLAPGTWGSLGAVAAYLAVCVAGGGRTANMVLPAAIALGLAAGVPLAGACQRRCGLSDPPAFVLDEVVGQWTTLILFVPAFNTDGLPRLLVLAGVAFAAFRIMDILKPWPVRRLEKLPGGWGVMLDDVLAGLFAAALSWGVAIVLGFMRVRP